MSETPEAMKAKILDDITRTFASPRWIPVTERLPDRNEMVLVVCSGKRTVGTFSPSFEDCWAVIVESSGFEPTDHVTHWMPIPAPPPEMLLDEAIAISKMIGELPVMLWTRESPESK